jgi:1-acyl-sn-glycerol-3-phosphate acyltransferase
MQRLHVYTIITIPLFGILYALTAITVLIASFFAFLRMKPLVIFITWLWAKSAFLVLGKKLHIQGKENLVKGSKYILVANHSSLFDIMAIKSFYPGVAWFGREYLLKRPIMGFILKSTG